MTNLCVSGCILSAISGLFSFCKTLDWLNQDLPACVATHILTSSTASVGISTVAALAVDKLFAITYHLRYKALASPTKGVLFILVQVSHFDNTTVDLGFLPHHCYSYRFSGPSVSLLIQYLCSRMELPGVSGDSEAAAIKSPSVQSCWS